jgi:uncharacterized protein
VKKGMSLVLTFVLIAGLLLGSGVQAEVWAAPPIVVLNDPATLVLAVTTVTSESIGLSWNESAGATKYIIERTSGSSSTIVSVTLPVTQNSHPNAYTDTGLLQGTTYNYSITAINADGLSIVSNVVQAKTNLPQPTDLRLTSVTETQVVIAWNDNSNNETGFQIERKTGSNPFSLLTTIGANATSYADTNLTNNVTYTYQVRAINIAGDVNSNYSNELSVTTTGIPAQPTELKSTSVSNTQVSISWKDNANNETGFLIERKTGSGAYSQIAEKSANATSHTDSGLTANTTYTYRVRAINAAGNSDFSNELPVTTTGIPAKPTELRTTSVSNTQIVIAWKDNSNNETGFRIERKIGNGSYSTLTTTGANATSFTNSGLTNNTVYTYRVRAVNVAGESDPSNELVVTTGTVPAKPETLKVTATGTDRITLSWTDKSNNEKGFRIERKTGSGSFSEITTVSAGVTNYTNTGLSNNTTYTYRIRAFNDSGNSDYSNEVTAKTGNTPAKPENLEASSVSTDRVTLTWKDRSDNEKGFRIERKTGTGSFSEIATTKANATSYTDTGLRNNTEYTYRIRAYNDDGNSEYSAELKVTTGTVPAKPDELTVTATSQDRVSLSWKDRSDNESGFKIERKTGNGSFTEIATVRSGVTTYTNTGLRNRTEYTYRVRAYNDTGHSPYSNEVRVTTGDVPEQPDRLAVISVDTDRVSLSWRDRSDNESGFIIERKTGTGSFVRIANVRANTTSYTDTGLASDQNYTYRVRAVNDSVESDPSNEITARTLRSQQPIVTRLQIGSTLYRVDGQQRQMDAAPIIYESRTLLPIRYVAEAIGATVLWDAQTEKVTILMEDRTIELWIGSNLARVNGVQMQIDANNRLVKPVIIPPGRTMMPLRFIAENLGCDVEWNETLQEVTVTYPGL